MSENHFGLSMYASVILTNFLKCKDLDLMNQEHSFYAIEVTFQDFRKFLLLISYLALGKKGETWCLFLWKWFSFLKVVLNVTNIVFRKSWNVIYQLCVFIEVTSLLWLCLSERVGLGAFIKALVSLKSCNSNLTEKQR